MSGPIGLLLAGGAGRRLGGAKATVPLAGRALLLHPLTALEEVVDRVAVVAKPDTELPGLAGRAEVWREPPEPRHPLAGVAEGLRRAAGRGVLVVAGDMPLVSAEVLRSLLAAAGSGTVLARSEGRLQPLLGVYAPAALEVIGAMAADEAAAAVSARLAPAVVDVPADTCLNVNTPADLRRAEAVLAALSRR